MISCRSLSAGVPSPSLYGGGDLNDLCAAFSSLCSVVSWIAKEAGLEVLSGHWNWAPCHPLGRNENQVGDTPRVFGWDNSWCHWSLSAQRALLLVPHWAGPKSLSAFVFNTILLPHVSDFSLCSSGWHSVTKWRSELSQEHVQGPSVREPPHHGKLSPILPISLQGWPRWRPHKPHHPHPLSHASPDVTKLGSRRLPVSLGQMQLCWEGGGGGLVFWWLSPAIRKCSWLGWHTSAMAVAVGQLPQAAG